MIHIQLSLQAFSQKIREDYQKFNLGLPDFMESLTYLNLTISGKRGEINSIIGYILLG